MDDGHDYSDPYDRHPTPELPPGWLVAAVLAGLAVISGCLIWIFGALFRAVMP